MYRKRCEDMFVAILFFISRYRISYLDLAKMYVVKLDAAVCLESTLECESNVTVLNSVLLPIQPCNFDIGFAITGY